jgi:hypothetical protein
MKVHASKIKALGGARSDFVLMKIIKCDLAIVPS